MVRFEQGDLLNLPFGEHTFDFVLCWGVLMHIPEVERAISELARVVKPNGFLIVSEVNMWSIESTLRRALSSALGRSLIRRLRGREAAELRVGAAGAEYWYHTEAGPLFVRQARIPWLIAEFRSRGLVIVERTAGQFTELYTSVPTNLLKRIMHAFNRTWFTRVRWPQPATGNLLIFQKEP
jgi:ubiquinone/menaquinone biosynthesis C-methylase UbiE